MDNPKALQHWVQDDDKQKNTTQRIKTRSNMDLTKITALNIGAREG